MIVPSCTGVEAEYLASRLIADRHPRLECLLGFGETAPPCPFYDPDSAYHCTVYAARPFVCRAFGFASSTGKDGSRAYRLCSHMIAPAGFGGCRSLTAAGGVAMPPAMPPIQAQIAGLSGGAPELIPFDRAVRSALERLLLSRQLADGELIGTTEPPDNVPDPEQTDPRPEPRSA